MPIPEQLEIFKRFSWIGYVVFSGCTGHMRQGWYWTSRWWYIFLWKRNSNHHLGTENKITVYQVVVGVVLFWVFMPHQRIKVVI